MFLDFTTEGPDLAILLFNHAIESLAFLAKSGQLVIAVTANTLESGLELDHTLLQVVVFDADILEFVLQFVQLSS